MNRRWVYALILAPFILFGLICLWMVSGCAQQEILPSEPSAQAAPETPTAPAPEPEPAPVDPAETYVDTLLLEQQIAQMFFIRCPETGTSAMLSQYDVGGLILFGRDFENQTPDTLRGILADYQASAHTPVLIGVDEEGGTVVRASAYSAFRAEKFRSPQNLYAAGGIELVLSDCAEKDAFLKDLGVNVNLAPVCDVSTDPNDFIYARAFGQAAQSTADYVAAVVAQMQQDGMGSVLKHFPGYGNNVDTHTGIAVDERPLETFESSDFLPFQAGTKAGAGAVLVSHNIVTCMDGNMPASLSPAVHEQLRKALGDDVVTMTDDLIMDAITEYTGGADAAVLAVKAGNDMMISSDFATQYSAVLAAVQAGDISADEVRTHCLRIIRWKMDLGLLDT